VTEADLIRRIYDDLNWAKFVAPAVAPAEPVDTWARLRELWDQPAPAFVAALYPVLLGRKVDERSLESACAALAAGHPRAELVRSLALCDEARAREPDLSWLPQLDALAGALAPRGPLPLRVARAVVRRLRRYLGRLRSRLGRRDPLPDRLATEAAGRLDQLFALVGQVREELLQAAADTRDRTAPLAAQWEAWRREEAGLREQRWQARQQAWFEHARQLEQLRVALTALAAPPAERPAAPPRPANAAPPRCRVCDGPLSPRWTRRVLHGRYDADYCECADCQALQVPDPHWLDEAYRDEAAPQAWNPDVGRFMRNFSAFCYLAALRESGALPPAPRLLDYGGGYGLLTRMLRDAGFDAWLADPYVPRPYFAPEHSLPDLALVPDASFDAATAFEVFEHLTDPRAVGATLRRLLRPEGILALSTEVYEPDRHGPDWNYLSCEAGQHVTFWSRDALRRLARGLGFRSVGYFPGDAGFLVLFSPESAEALRRRLAAALNRLNGAGFFDRVTRGWDFHRNGVVRPAAPVAEALDAQEGGA
jgi:hypothetical protein